jgi:uncharacterized membrane protein YqaE (UPF0057 family)
MTSADMISAVKARQAEFWRPLFNSCAGTPAPGRRYHRSAARSAPRRKQGIPMDIVRIIAAILLPPLGVFLQVGIGVQFWINILLTLLGYIPGIVHAVWIIARR